MNTPNTTASSETDSPQAGSENCLPLGTRLAEFELTAIIGEGGFGIVYQAFDHSLQRTVAIKEYMPSSLAGRGADKSVVVRSKRQQDTFNTGLKSFIHEARLLAQFDHPALIKVYRFWEENKTGYMAMRCYEGVTLKRIIENDPTRVTEAWLRFVLKPILEALEVLYKVQILHRDISPDNIIIQRTGEPVLLDFGAARQIIGDMTQALTVILKPGYAPIEQYADDASMQQGPWTDIYSLSAVVYALIVKKPPPTSVARMINDPIETLETGANPGFSQEFLSAVNRGLAVKPDDRPQSIDQFRTLLGIGPTAPTQADGFSASILPISPGRKIPDHETNHVAAAARSSAALPKVATGAPTFAKPAQPRPNSHVPKVILAIVAAGIVAAAASAAYLLINHKNEPAISTATQTSAPADANGASFASSAADARRGAALDVASSEETGAWEALHDEQPIRLEAVISFLRKYPSGKYAGLAREKLAELQANSVARPRPAFKSAQERDAAAAGVAAPGAHRPAHQQADDKTLKPARTIRILIKPWGTVLLDGAEKGVSPPLKKLTVPDGKHQIRIVNPGFPDHVVEVDAGTKKPDRIEHDFSPGKK